MKKFILKLTLYVFMILALLELIVRVFHLYNEIPPSFIDEYGVEKRVPEHTGHTVTGNRKQNFSEFDINESGFNSFREFRPSRDKFEIAIIGDSFIEGLHQDYHNSIGKKIEDRLPQVEVYEYGYAGYDLANQMHLINSYKEKFELIDKIIIYLNYKNDLQRNSYKPNRERIARLSSTMFRLRNDIKILSYGSKIGVLEPIKKMVLGKAFQDNDDAYKSNKIQKETPEERNRRNREYLNNFKSLVELFGFDKTKTVLLLDSRKTSKTFLDYCDSHDFQYIDFSKSFEETKKPTTLIFDRHWNNHGRDLIASEIVKYIKTKEQIGQD